MHVHVNSIEEHIHPTPPHPPGPQELRIQLCSLQETRWPQVHEDSDLMELRFLPVGTLGSWLVLLGHTVTMKEPHGICLVELPVSAVRVGAP